MDWKTKDLRKELQRNKMKAAIHYVVKAKLIRYQNADEIKFLEIEEILFDRII